MATISTMFKDTWSQKKQPLIQFTPINYFRINDSYNKYIIKEKFPKKSPE